MVYRREIDGLRAVAVLPVILFHAGFESFSGGYVGVDVFFVISGYLITSLIAAEIQDGRFTLVNFYERRLRRILPALLFVMLICLPFAWLWLLPDDLRRFSESLVAVPTFSSNILFYLSSGYFGSEEKPLLHTWSLAVEEQYYVFFPLFLLLTWRLGKRRVVTLLVGLACISLAAAQWYSVHNPILDFLMLPTRFWELLVGALLTLYPQVVNANKTRLWAREIASGLGIVMIVYATLIFTDKTPFPGSYALVPTLGAALIIASTANSKTIVGKFLASDLLVGIGLVSYSAYLWHQPLFAFARNRSIDEPGKAILALLSVVSLVLAYFSWKYIETPFRDRKRFTRKHIFLWGAAGSSLFIAIGIAGVAADGFKSRMPAEVLAVDITREHEQQLKLAGCVLHGDAFVISECIKGDADVVPTYALVGDSHAQSITAELASAFAKEHISFIPFVKAHCPLDFHMRATSNDEDVKCARYQKAIKDAKNDVKTYIIFSRRDLPLTGPGPVEETDFQENIRSVLDLLESGKRVILVYPIPVYTVRIADYMSKNLLFYGGSRSSITVRKATFESRTKYFRDGYDAIGSHPNLARVYPNQILCQSAEDGLCVTAANGVPLYFDESHLSNAGARLLVGKIMEAVRR